MARILPGSLGSTFSGVERARELRAGAVDYARAPDTPHGFDALAKTLQHPLTGMATSAISRIGDELAYSNAVDEEKERLDKAKFEYQQAQEQAQNASRYRQQLEQEVSDPNMQMAIRDAMSGPAPQVGPQVDLGHVGFAPGTGGTPGHPPMEQAMQAVAQPQPVGWRHPATGREYTREQLAAIPAEIDRLRQEEAQAAGPAPQEQFVPRTVAEFQFAIASEPDPQRRQELLMQSRRAVDAQPGGIEEAIKGTAGAAAQKATRGADTQAQKTRHEQSAKREDLLRRREEFDFDRDYKEAKHALNTFAEQSKAGKRASEVKLNEVKLKKFNRRMAASMRRRGSPDWFKAFIKDKHGGDFASAIKKGDTFWSGLYAASPDTKSFKGVRKVVAQHLKDTGLDDEAKSSVINSELIVERSRQQDAQKKFDDIMRDEGVAVAELQAMRPQFEDKLVETNYFSADDPPLQPDYWKSAKHRAKIQEEFGGKKGAKPFFDAFKRATANQKAKVNAGKVLKDASAKFQALVNKSKGLPSGTYEMTVQPQGQPQGSQMLEGYLVEAE